MPWKEKFRYRTSTIIQYWHTKMQALLSLLWLVSTAQALYFFIDGATPKCFYEELPKDTLVSGQYAAEEYDDRTASWQQHQGLNIFITVDVRGLRSLLQRCSFVLHHMLTCLFLPGGIQRPPRCQQEGRLLREVPFHCPRSRRPQDLLHTLVNLRSPLLALHQLRQWRNQAQARHGYRCQ